MGFFGEAIDSSKGLETSIPDFHSLQLLQACISFNSSAELSEYVSLFVKTVNDEYPILLCTLSGKNKIYQCALTHEFGPEDSPISFTIEGTGILHLSGKWSWDDDDNEEEEEDNYEDEGDEEIINESKTEINSSNSKDETKKRKDVTNSDNNVKKSKLNEQNTSKQIENPVDSNKPKEKNRKVWKVKPENDEGILVPEPKMLKKASGVYISDFVIGNGSEPKLGGMVFITYTGMYPNGEIFDSNLKRSKPFSFRLGTNQVIKGMDLGIEGVHK